MSLDLDSISKIKSINSIYNNNSHGNNTFVLHDFLTFSVKGLGRLKNYLNLQFKDFLVSNEIDPKKIDLEIIVEKKRKKIEPNKSIKGDSQQSYGRSNNDFILIHKNKEAVLDGSQAISDQIKLKFDPKFSAMEANLICELIFRMKTISSETILLHASSTDFKGNGYIFPAWKGTGKTTACMKLLELGHGYLADDRVWVSSEKKIFAYPRYIVVNESNIDFFPNTLNNYDKIKISIKQISNYFKISNGIIHRLVNKYTKIPSKHYLVNHIYPSVELIEQSKLKYLVFLEKDFGVNTIFSSKLDTGTSFSKIQSISNFEWNSDLMKIAAAHDFLFPDMPNWSNELSHLFAMEKIIIEKILINLPCHLILLPKDKLLMDWPLFTKTINQL